MRILLNIFALLLLFVGGVWFLQGMGVLPGSFMTGSLMWEVIGFFCIVAGIGLLVSANRAKS